jgi:hypothetical protein
MDDLAIEEIRHRREADMRVRPDIETMSRSEICGPHMIEEDERPDMTARLCGKHAAHGKAAEIARSGIDHSCDPMSRGAARAMQSAHRTDGFRKAGWLVTLATT